MRHSKIDAILELIDSALAANSAEGTRAAPTAPARHESHARARRWPVADAR
jgi:hypothetical protein